MKKSQLEILVREVIQETIRKVDGKYVVYPEKGGKRLGTHSTKKAAEKQLTAIHLNKEAIVKDEVHCDGCGWKWKIAEGGKHPYTCHKCGHDNTPIEDKIYKLVQAKVKPPTDWETRDWKLFENITYSKPNFAEEWKEAERYPEFKEMGKQGWINIAKKGYVTSYSKIKNILGNVDLNFDGLEGPKKQRFQDAFKKGTIEMSIAVKFSDNDYDLVAGNTRLSGQVKNNIDPKIWIVDISNLQENYADGKVKGKSRPGRAKRAGVDCSKSITDLRKIARNSSGEKQKMAHFCANMKSGRKK